MGKKMNRRAFLKKAGGTAVGAVALTLPSPTWADESSHVSFRSSWPREAQRQWPGPEYWPNPLQDWRVQNGRLECFSPGGDRNVALLTHDVAARSGDLMLSVRTGRIDTAVSSLRGFVGFRVGIKNQMDDYRATAIYGRGMDVGINADGRLFIGTLEASTPRIDLEEDAHLQLNARPSSKGYTVLLRATGGKGIHAAEVSREVPADWLIGGLALVCSSGPVEPTPVPLEPIKDFSFYPPRQHRGGTMSFWFADWTVGGSKVDEHDDRAFGPILFTLYTLSRGTMKLSAQFPPLGNAPNSVVLQLRAENGDWKTVAATHIDPDAWNALFRIAEWDSKQAHAYRVLYTAALDDGPGKQYVYEGTIQKDPVDKKEVTTGLLTCLWDFGFPHNDLVKNIAWHKPDILLWTGDQIYEPNGGFGVIESRVPDMVQPSMYDYLRKWYVFGWAVRDLTRDIPSIFMTDDHDMYHGNIWGCGGRPTNPALGEGAPQQDSGGYKMAPRWVNMVQRVQTSHLPDPYDPTPVLQGISVYYTDLLWGGVSYAIMEDRKWKSAPKQQLPDADIFNGFPRNPAWNAAVQSNVPDAELLGQRQLDFLESWAADWSGGTWMKYAVSQTPFACLHTEPEAYDTDDHDPENNIPPVGTYIDGDHLVADHDSGAWPQHGRDAGILKWRKAFASHLCGDQHLGSTMHYGIREFRDGVISICTPAMSNIWPRRWFPPNRAQNALPGTRNTGDYLDAFGNRMTVFAAASPARYSGPELEGLRFRVTGYTVVICNRDTRKITLTEWPRWVDPSAPGAKPYDGWPLTFDQIDNGLWGAQWELIPVETPGIRDPVIQVQNESDGEIVYTIRINQPSFTPLLRDAGTYTVIAYDPDGDYRKEWKGIEARKRQL